MIYRILSLPWCHKIIRLTLGTLNNWTSRHGVGVAFAGKAWRIFLFLFCLEHGLERASFCCALVPPPPYPREGISDGLG